MQKAFAYLDAQGISYDFIDYKKQKPTLADLDRWKAGFGDWPVNKQGTSYRKIKEQYETATETQQASILIETPSAMKRPILEGQGLLIKGFDAEKWPSN